MDQILGQPRAVEALQCQLSTGHLHHALIFYGPTGVGKYSTALALARIILCHKPIEGVTESSTVPGEEDRGFRSRQVLAACGTCVSCGLLPMDSSGGKATLASTHPDLHLVVKELAHFDDDRAVRDRKLTQIPVQVLRSALIGPASLVPKLSYGKVFIVDEAELLNSTGQNLLLKTLEEPPVGTVIILVTSDEERLLPTIRSRCHRIAFIPLSDEVVAQWIKQQQQELNAEERRWLVWFANGSLGRARLAIDFELIQWGRQVLPAVDQCADRKPPGNLGQLIAEQIDGFAKQWVDRYPGASKEAANRFAGQLMWSMIAGHARSRLSSVVDSLASTEPTQAEVALRPWIALVEACGRAQEQLAANVNLSMVCDHLVVELDRCFCA